MALNIKNYDFVEEDNDGGVISILTLVPSSSLFLQLFGQPTTTVFGFIPPRPVVWRVIVKL